MGVAEWEQFELGHGGVCGNEKPRWQMPAHPTSLPGPDGVIRNGLIVSTNAVCRGVKHITYRAKFFQGGKDPVHGGGGDQARERQCVWFNGKDIYSTSEMNGSEIRHDTGEQVLVGWEVGKPLSIFMYGTENGHWPVNYPSPLYKGENLLTVYFFDYVPESVG